VTYDSILRGRPLFHQPRLRSKSGEEEVHLPVPLHTAEAALRPGGGKIACHSASRQATNGYDISLPYVTFIKIIV
jgi:hypothetical protein